MTRKFQVRATLPAHLYRMLEAEALAAATTMADIVRLALVQRYAAALKALYPNLPHAALDPDRAPFSTSLIAPTPSLPKPGREGVTPPAEPPRR
jgi:hypothetical protein